MFGFSTLLNIGEFVLVLSLGIKFNEKWPNAASKVAFLLTAVEKVAVWIYGLFKSANPTATTPTK